MTALLHELFLKKLQIFQNINLSGLFRDKKLNGWAPLDDLDFQH